MIMPRAPGLHDRRLHDVLLELCHGQKAGCVAPSLSSVPKEPCPNAMSTCCHFPPALAGRKQLGKVSVVAAEQSLAQPGGSNSL